MGGAGSGGGYQIIARPESFASTAASFLARKIASLGARGPVSVALSGGRTPAPVYRLLAASPLPAWDTVSIYFADERAVPRDDPSSNFRLVRETLLDGTAIPLENVHPMMPESFAGSRVGGTDETGHGPDLDDIARSYEEGLPERLDLVVLGLGDDGHTASLFPGSAVLQEQQRRVVLAIGPKEPRRRLTITPPVVAAARLVVVLVSGSTKSRALRQALRRGSISDVPGRLARTGIWIIASNALPPHTDLSSSRATTP